MSYPARKPMSFLLCLSLLICCVVAKGAPGSHPGARQKEARASARSPRRRALLVAINTYKPVTGADSKTEAAVERVTPNKQPAARSKGGLPSRGDFTDLTGPKNDLKEIREVIGKKYGFTDVKTLEDQQATRNGILKAIEELIASASRGDSVLFFYSGHGSRVRNSKNGEGKGYDESIVPADSNQGARDIRDKELARRFLKATDKGVVLTAIFDSCHSGSIARGASEERSRTLAFDERDVAEEPGFAESPERKGALVLSAAQDYEEAKERPYNNIWRGNFSWALAEVLKRDTTSKDESASLIFQKVIALMKNKGVREEPVLAGNERRIKGTLFDGTPSPVLPPVATVKNREANTFELTGALTVSLGIGSELKSQKVVSGQQPVRMRVTEVIGLTGCRAIAIEGAHETVSTGDAFVLDRWVSQNAANLKVWMPPALSRKDLNILAKQVQDWRSSGQMQLIDDPTEIAAEQFIHLSESGWLALTLSARIESLGPALSLSKLAAGEMAKAPVFVNLPPAIEFKKAIKVGGETEASAIEIVKTTGEADYILAGRVREGKVAYAWVRLGVLEEEARKGGNSLPARSDWFDTPEELQVAAIKLARISAWLNLDSSTGEPFPFKVALRETAAGKIITGGEVYVGLKYDLVLVPQEAAKKASRSRPIKRQRVYVFAIDAHGKSTLLYPLSNVENRFPFDPDNPTAATYDNPITEPIRLEEEGFITMDPDVLGLDTYVLIASDQSIPDPFVLQADGPRTERGSRGPDGEETELSRLVDGIGNATRGPKPKAQLSWTIERTIIRSAKQPK